MVGLYQHCGEAHLHRYIAVLDFGYNRRTILGVSDAQNAADLLHGARDKRLTNRRVGEPATPKQKARRSLWALKHRANQK